MNNEKDTFVEDEPKTRPLQANQHITGGIKGVKVMKNKTKEDDLATWTNARRDMKNNSIQKIVGNLGIADNVEKCDIIAGNLRSMSVNFETDAINTIKKQYDDKRKNKKKFNNGQMQRDLELTATTKGTIPFSKLAIKHIPGVREELRVRGYTYKN